MCVCVCECERERRTDRLEEEGEKERGGLFKVFICADRRFCHGVTAAGLKSSSHCLLAQWLKYSFNHVTDMNIISPHKMLFILNVLQNKYNE